MTKNIKNSGADLTFEELDALANDIHMALTNGRPVTIQEYVNLAKTINLIDLGYRNSKAIHNETRLMAYFPDEVISALQQRNLNNLKFNDKDNEFILKNRMKGFKWLSVHFYTSLDSIQKKAKSLKIEVESNLHKYTEEENQFILKNLDKSWVWLAKKLNISADSVRQHAKQLIGDKARKKPKQHTYTKEENGFIKKNRVKGWTWMAKKLNLSKNAVILHATKTLKLKIK